MYFLLQKHSYQKEKVIKYGSKPLILIRKISTHFLLTEKKEDGLDLDYNH